MGANNWETIQSHTVYENPWVQVEHHDVITPAGKPGIYGVVKFKNKAIGIVPVDDDGFTYLVGQYRYTLGEYSWEIPEGGGPLVEDPLAAAQRELKEETGLVAENWQRIGRIHTSNSVTDEEGFIFLAQGLTQGDAEPEETEQLQVRRVALTEAVAMVMRSEITDSISMCAILMAARMMGV
ncbi:NUDIX hydrolase [Parapedobacter sp. ISTM3]|uniref:GDP-mannose pyrophosphatase n=1 Tax=Parapedobacter luteus TaxID=623280 RepID=A0A1T5ALY4_9SPHI|nr:MULTISPECIES: NUDIX hydrolase [Parapedobacter]MBK1441689.1 NUDIX hydrolase [Parapedobacter sp. ISTM3]SKB35895.1 8-oxo-dGTP pyrophosphatase MutT, NUDIX family [Parapedobacter luteus]